MAKSRNLRINGLALETRWEFASSLNDERGHTVLGVVEYDPAVHRTALVYLNNAELAERDDLTRSTAAHELGHAIFDAPGWIRTAEKSSHAQEETPRSLYRTVVRSYRSPKKLEPAEWRANEFMGAFLAPPRLLRRHMLKVLVELRLPRTFAADGLPVIDTRQLGAYQLQAVADELAEAFGLSIGFMEYRLHRYGFAPVHN
jgi:hypothetical protein